MIFLEADIKRQGWKPWKERTACKHSIHQKTFRLPFFGSHSTRDCYMWYLTEQSFFFQHTSTIRIVHVLCYTAVLWNPVPFTLSVIWIIQMTFFQQLTLARFLPVDSCSNDIFLAVNSLKWHLSHQITRVQMTHSFWFFKWHSFTSWLLSKCHFPGTCILFLD